MGIATSPLHSSKGYNYSSSQVLNKKNFSNSMSQEYHTGVFSFLNGFERSQQEQQQQQQILGPQIRRDKLRVQGFEAALPLVGIEDEASGGINPVYETAGMLSEMFNFPPGGVTTATELLENQISQSYRNTRSSPLAGAAAASGDWFLNRQGMVVGGGLDPLVDSKNQTVVNDTVHHHHHHQQQQISSINADSAAVMQLFLMNPQQQRSPSPSSSHPRPHPPPTSSTLHMLLPNTSPSSSTLHGFHSTAPGGPEGSFGTAWVPNSGNETNRIEIPGLVEGQGLSLSLSSSLQHLEAAKAEELRIGGDGGMLYFGQGGGSAPPQYQFKNMTSPGGTGGGVFHLQSGVGHNHQLQVGLGSSIAAFNMLRNSKYAKAAQELLEEFCSVGRGQFKKNKFSSKQNNNTNPSSNPPAGTTSGGAAAGGSSSSTSKDLPPLSASDRLEHQRRKVKLLSMLDEVDRRYNHYCEQMQMVVNSFDMVMGFGAAVQYTSLAQKAMSRHFRCLKEAVSAQLKHSCEVLGEKDAGSSGITKGETPRLRILEQSLRQQRAFHQMGMMEQEAWRPQRGLPERSVNILRAWLFEHFLHPYPSDADKHLLARQTGLSRNQVSNWFINARVRLWKPMVEDMYQQESKDETTQDQDQGQGQDQTNNNAQTPTPNPTTATNTAVETPTITSPAITQPGKVSEFNAPESDPSFITINDQCFLENQAKLQQNNNAPLPSATILSSSSPAIHNPDTCRRGGTVDHYPTSHHPTNAGTLIRFGTSTGDVSLTLGLRHAGNLPEKRQFSVRDFGGC